MSVGGDGPGAVDLEPGDEGGQPLTVGCAGVDREPNTPRDDVDPARLDLEPADGRHGAVDRLGDIADPQDLGGGANERVVALAHRRRAGVPGAAVDHALATDVADDAGDDGERGAGAGETRPLLVMELDERARQRAVGDPCSGSRRSRAPPRERRPPPPSAASGRAAPRPRAPRAPRAGRRSGRLPARNRDATPTRPPAARGRPRSTGRSGCRRRRPRPRDPPPPSSRPRAGAPRPLPPSTRRAAHRARPRSRRRRRGAPRACCSRASRLDATGPPQELTPAIRAAVGRLRGAQLAEGAFVGADARVVRVRRQRDTAHLALGSHLQCHESNASR